MTTNLVTTAQGTIGQTAFVRLRSRKVGSGSTSRELVGQSVSMSLGLVSASVNSTSRNLVGQSVSVALGSVTGNVVEGLRYQTIQSQQFTLGIAANLELDALYLINPNSLAGTHSHPTGTLQTGITYNTTLGRLEYDGGGSLGTTTGHTVAYTTTDPAPTWTSTPSFTFQEGVAASFSLTPYLSAGTFTFAIIAGGTAWLSISGTSLVASGTQVDANSASLTIRATRTSDGQYVDSSPIPVSVEVTASPWTGVTQIEFWANDAPVTSRAHLVQFDLAQLLTSGFEDNDIFSLAPSSPALPSFASFANSPTSSSFRLFTPNGSQIAGSYNFTLRYYRTATAQTFDRAMTIVVLSGATNGLQILPGPTEWSYGMKHVGLIYCPAIMTGGAGPLVFAFDGDYRGAAPYTPDQSYQQGTTKIDPAAALAAPTTANAGFSVAYSNGGRGGTTVQPKAPDFCGHPVDTLRGFIPHVPGVMEIPTTGNLGPGESQADLPFTSGGNTEIIAGNTITGATSGATALVLSAALTSGSWAGGNAAGTFKLSSQVLSFVAENLNVGASANLATISANSYRASDPNWRLNEIMKFRPNALNSDTTWESWVSLANSNAAETWHCVYDAVTDRYLRPNIASEASLDVFNPTTGLYGTSLNLGTNGLGQTAYIKKEYLACDWGQRKLYIADGAHHRLMCINLGTGASYTNTTFDDLGLLPGAQAFVENYKYILFHDTPHVLEFLNIYDSRHYTADAHVRPLVWVDRGRMPNHRAGVYIPSLNKSMWGGGGDGGAENFLTFYQYTP